MKIIIDTAAKTLVQESDQERTSFPLFSKEAFDTISAQWVQIGWSLCYYYNFSWFGHPILQMPEDLLRFQEVIYQVRPKAIIETGVFQGGSLLFYATLLEAMGGGRVVGIDLAIPPEVRESLCAHRFGHRISLLKGDSTDPKIVTEAQKLVAGLEPVMVILDSGHTRVHVARELDAYSPLVTEGSYIVVADGIMRDLTDVPHGSPEWKDDNPLSAANDFIARHPEFRQESPQWSFHFGPITENVTYCPGGWLRRIGGTGGKSAPTGLAATEDSEQQILGGTMGDQFSALAKLQERYRKKLGMPRTTLERDDLCEVPGAIQELRATSEQVQIQVGPHMLARILTLRGAWSYAAVVPLQIPSNLDGQIWVRIRTRVLQGEGGFGLFERSGIEFQDRALLGVRGEVQTIFLQVMDPATAAYLIIQNATPDGQPADILLEEVTVLGPPRIRPASSIVL